MTPVTLRVRSLIVREEHLLLCRLASRPVAFLPGGRVEAEETLEAAMRRELIEETGCDPGRMSYLGAVEHLWTEGQRRIHDLSHFFHASCESLRPTVTPRCNDEGVEMLWVAVKAVHDQPIKPNVVKGFIEKWLSGDPTVWWASEREF